MAKISTITLGILLLTAITARAQDTVYNRFSLDAQFGVNSPTDPMAPEYDSPTFNMFHVGLGARYMFTQRFGLRLGLGYDQFGERDRTPEFQTDYYSATLEGVANLGKIFHFKQRRFGLLLHAGLGYAAMSNDSAPETNHMATAVIGLTPQFRLGERVNLYLDASGTAHVYQNYTYDFTRTHSQRGVDGHLYSLSIGIQFNLGKNAVHADWASEDKRQEDLSALQERIRRLEEQQKDDDGDGVANYLDEEPGTPPGTNVDTKGRTVVEKPRDSDSDGITDDVDDCPFEKGAPRTRGCPEATGNTGGNTGTTGGNSSAIGMVESSEVKFPTDVAEVSPSFAKMLDGIATVMKDNPSYNLNIVGHADDRASEEYNMDLSQRRADAVKAYLVSKGVAASRLTTTAKGETQPKVNATTDEARAENRRVQFIVKR